MTAIPSTQLQKEEACYNVQVAQSGTDIELHGAVPDHVAENCCEVKKLGSSSVVAWSPEKPAELADSEHELSLHPWYARLWSNVKPSKPSHGAGIIPHVMPVKALHGHARTLTFSDLITFSERVLRWCQSQCHQSRLQVNDRQTQTSRQKCTWHAHSTSLTSEVSATSANMRGSASDPLLCPLLSGVACFPFEGRTFSFNAEAPAAGIALVTERDT